MFVLSVSYWESDIYWRQNTNISLSLPHKMAENSWYEEITSLSPMYCGRTAGWIRMPLSMEVGLSPGDIVLDGDPASPSPKGAQPPQFLSNVRCGQTTEWMKSPLGTEVDLGPGHIV